VTGDPLGLDPEIEAVKRRALVGSALVGARGLVVSLLGFGSVVVLSRSLSPNDFGVVALGSTLASAGALLSQVGLGAGLIRRPEPPTRSELRALTGVQLVAALVLVGIVAAIALPSGRTGEVVTAMIALLPLLAFRTPGIIVLERELKYGMVVRIEVIETLTYVCVLVPLILFGLGVWGAVVATNARWIAGVALVKAAVPSGGVVLPTREFGLVRKLMRFGLQYQAVDVAGVGLGQGLNVGTFAIGGPTTLGVWSVTWRLLQIPFLLFGAVWRVSFPSMSALVARGVAVRSTIERGARLASVATGLLLVPMAAGAPVLVPKVFGASYQEAGTLILPFCLGMQFTGPVSVSLVGHLFARGEARTVLKSTLVQGVLWLGIAFTLLPVLGVMAIGVGFLPAAASEALIFTRAANRLDGIKLGRAVSLPFAIAIPAAAGGYLISQALDGSLGAGLAGALLAVVAFVLVEFSVDPDSWQTFRALPSNLRADG
jgi:O-antigen/teichoic acid export membrane protein